MRWSGGPSPGTRDGVFPERRLATWAQLRDVGVHTLLGTLQEGAMGGEAQDGQGPT